MVIETPLNMCKMAIGLKWFKTPTFQWIRPITYKMVILAPLRTNIPHITISQNSERRVRSQANQQQHVKIAGYLHKYLEEQWNEIFFD
jgi:hypothetical protein